MSRNNKAFVCLLAFAAMLYVMLVSGMIFSQAEGENDDETETTSVSSTVTTSKEDEDSSVSSKESSSSSSSHSSSSKTNSSSSKTTTSGNTTTTSKSSSSLYEPQGGTGSYDAVGSQTDFDNASSKKSLEVSSEEVESAMPHSQGGIQDTMKKFAFIPIGAMLIAIGVLIAVNRRGKNPDGDDDYDDDDEYYDDDYDGYDEYDEDDDDDYDDDFSNRPERRSGGDRPGLDRNNPPRKRR